MEEMDIEQSGELVAYLRATGRIEPTEDPVVTVLAGGVSNRTVLVERASGEAWVVKQALAKLRVAVDWFSSPERIHREALGLRWLNHAVPGCTPTLVFEDDACHLLGMAAAPEPHENWKAMLLAGRLETDHVEQFARLLGTIHRVGAEHQAETEATFGDRGFFESLRLEPYYVYSGAQVPAAAGFIDALVAETMAAHPARQTVVHGDYSPKNILVHDGRLILLDHEVMHFGDPGFDLGFSLTHLLSKAHHLSPLRAAFRDAAVRYWDVYRDSAGAAEWTTDLEQRAVRHTLGCLLARARGRSPLEYLDEPARTRQTQAVVRLIAKPPSSIALLADRFLAEIERQEA